MFRSNEEQPSRSKMNASQYGYKHSRKINRDGKETHCQDDRRKHHRRMNKRSDKS